MDLTTIEAGPRSDQDRHDAGFGMRGQVAATLESDREVALAIVRYLHLHAPPTGWVLLHSVAANLDFEDVPIQRAVRHAVDRAWLIPNGDPTNAISLTDSGAVVAAKR